MGGGIQIAAHCYITAPVKRGSEGRGRGTDQIGAAHHRGGIQCGPQTIILGLTASDPVDIVKCRQRARCRYAICGLAVIDELQMVVAGNRLQAMRQPGKAGHAGRNRFRAASKILHAGGNGSRIFPIMITGKGRTVTHGSRCHLGTDHRKCSRPLTQIIGQFHNMCITAANHTKPMRGQGSQRAGLCCHIAVHAAMPVKVIRCDIQQNGNIGGQRRCCFKLIGRHFEDNHPVLTRIGQIAGGIADIAADGDRNTGTGKTMPQQCGGGRFAVGAGDDNQSRCRACPQRNFNLADDGNACFSRPRRSAMRGRQMMRNAGADHQGIKAGPGPVLPGGDLCSLWHVKRRRWAGFRPAVIMQPQMRTHAGQRARRRHA